MSCFLPWLFSSLNRCRLGENAEQLKDMHHRLEEALCRAAALESQQAEHAAACVGQKERLQQTEQDLKMMEDQYNQTRLRFVPGYYYIPHFLITS